MSSTISRRVCGAGRQKRAIAGLVMWGAMVGLACAQVVVPPGSTLTMPFGGTLNLGCTPLSVQGDLLLGAGQVSRAAGIHIAASGVLDGGSGTIGNGGSWNNAGSFIPGTGTVVLSTDCTSGPIQLTGNTSFHNLTLTSTTGGTFIIPAGQGITVDGTLTLQGQPGQPIQLLSSSGQTAYVTLGPTAQVVASYATVPPGVQIGAPTTGPTAIPTLGAYGALLLSLLLAAAAAGGVRIRSLLTRRVAH